MSKRIAKSSFFVDLLYAAAQLPNTESFKSIRRHELCIVEKEQMYMTLHLRAFALHA